MLYFSPWKIGAILAVVVAGCVLAFANLIPDRVVQTWPKWAQRQIVLGLDLQGGSHLLLEVDSGAVRKEMLENLRDDIRRVLREAKVGYTGLAVRGNGVDVRIREGADLAQVRTKLRELSQPIGGLLSGSGQQTVELSEPTAGSFRLTLTEPGINNRIRQAVDQSIQIVERRVNELGTVEPLVQRQGADRIVLQVPGLQNPQRLKDLLGQTAKLTFRLVDPSTSPEQAQNGQLPPDSELLKGSKKEGEHPYVVEKRIMVSGEDLTDAQPGFDQRTNEPIVNFRFNTKGAQAFARVTQENVGRPFAIVLDNEVISAPVIREPILGGSGQISGNFTVEGANDLAILLRAGALPAPLTIVEERTVGPGLGADSIRAGTVAAVVGTVFVFVFLIVSYGLFGLFANVGMLINVCFTFATLSLLGATLTLPGIAGIVLSIGMAVDANVLIFERIREEQQQGRSAISSIETGFTKAMGTITDANLTLLIASVVLYFFGTGPIRGFAVTLAIGNITSFFTAVTVTRLIVAQWVRFTRPRYVRV